MLSECFKIYQFFLVNDRHFLSSERGMDLTTVKNAIYSGHILKSIGHSSCVRVSFAHYNSIDEVKVFLRKFSDVLKDAH